MLATLLIMHMLFIAFLRLFRLREETHASLCLCAITLCHIHRQLMFCCHHRLMAESPVSVLPTSDFTHVAKLECADPPVIVVICGLEQEDGGYDLCVGVFGPPICVT
jgi:hypothetical protein